VVSSDRVGGDATPGDPGGSARIVVDRERCVGAGQCVLTEPAVFDQSDDDGRLELLMERPGAERLDRVRNAVYLCPGGALSLVES
jgi:ferredoxin